MMPFSLPASPATLLAGLLALLVLAGCGSSSSRSKEKAAVFDALDPHTQARLEAKEIHVGDTPPMVYIALRNPSEKQEKITAAGRSGLWIYSVYWQEYQGTRLVGYRRDVVYDAGSKSYRVSYSPDYQPVYTPRVEDRIRVTFEGGRVTAVEQALPDATPENSAIK